jgi:hypothetical protein
MLASTVLVIDSKTDTVSTMKCVGGNSLELIRWNGIAAVGSKLYCAPFMASSVLVIKCAPILSFPTHQHQQSANIIASPLRTTLSAADFAMTFNSLFNGPPSLLVRGIAKVLATTYTLRAV